MTQRDDIITTEVIQEFHMAPEETKTVSSISLEGIVILKCGSVLS